MTTLAGHRPFLLFVSARAFFSEFSYQIGTVAIGWQVYARTGSAFALGMVGLLWMKLFPTLRDVERLE
jgi:hypothetical protein